MSEQETRFWNRFLELSKDQFTARTFEISIQPAKFSGIKDNQAQIQLTDFQQKLWKGAFEEKIMGIFLMAGFEVYGREIIPAYLTNSQEEDDEFIGDIFEKTPAEQPVIQPPTDYNLNPNYRFDNFIQGEGNRWSLAAANAVAERPGTAYNPLFIWGGPGLGKTHLLNAIGNQVLARNPSAKIKYITTEEFVNIYINATRSKTMEEVRQKFRHLDVLLIDDIHTLNNKTGTQEEFFNTFNALYKNDKQIVITSDRAPDQLNDLENRLVSRFAWGLTQDITPPDYETRVAILLDKTQDSKYDFQPEAIDYLANQLDSNVRELEGALKNINLIATTRGSDTITIDLVAEALRSLKPTDVSITVIPIEKIQEEVCSFYGVTVKDIKGTKRVQTIALPRQIAMYLVRELTDYSLPKIGKEFGNRDHSTVLHSYKKIKDLLESDSNLKIDIEAIRAKLR